MRAALVLGAACLLGAGGVLALRWTSAKPTFDPATTRDLGDVAPGASVDARFVVRNDGSQAIYLSGLDKACGLTASLDGNPVILPGRQSVLLMHAQADRRRGGSGVRFALTRTQGNRQEETQYTLLWTVVGRPWLSRSEVWLKRSGAPESLSLHDQTKRARLVVHSAPSWALAEAKGQRLVLSLKDPVPGPASGFVECEAVDGRNSARYSIPVSVAAPRTGARVYPPRAYVEAGSKEPVRLEIVGSLSRGTSLKTSPGVRATLVGRRLLCSVAPDAAGPQRVALMAPDGLEVCAATLVVGTR